MPASVAYSDGVRSVTYQLTKRCMVIGRRTAAETADIEVPAEVFPDVSRQYALLPSSPNTPETDGLKNAAERTERQTYVLICASLTRSSIRHSSCDSPAVACRHAKIVLNGGDWLLQPISANRTVHNPTFLNGQQVFGSCKLVHGDTIILGAPLRARPCRSGIGARRSAAGGFSCAGQAADAIGGCQIKSATNVGRRKLACLR